MKVFSLSKTSLQPGLLSLHASPTKFRAIQKHRVDPAKLRSHLFLLGCQTRSSVDTIRLGRGINAVWEILAPETLSLLFCLMLKFEMFNFNSVKHVIFHFMYCASNKACLRLCTCKKVRHTSATKQKVIPEPCIKSLVHNYMHKWCKRGVPSNRI